MARRIVRRKPAPIINDIKPRTVTRKASRKPRRVVIKHGDCIDMLRELPDASIDAIVTDPPYGLEFMGKDWDAPWKGDVRQKGDDSFTEGASRHGKVRHGIGASYGGDTQRQMQHFQQWTHDWCVEAFRVLKPGGHMLVFGGTRTWHRMAVAVEDAGFEIRDNIAWMYGSGFPKSLDVSKAIDKAAGATREVVGKSSRATGPSQAGANGIGTFRETNWQESNLLTAPATPDAARWQGWGTALKPAFEPIVVARKPLIGTVAANVLAHGTGALNVDGCRVGTDGGTAGATAGPSTGILGDGLNGDFSKPVPGLGRWPSNVILDESQARALDAMSGSSKSSSTKVAKPMKRQDNKVYGTGLGTVSPDKTYDDIGGASRFFYCPKANKKERPVVDGVAHPTVKPVALMQYLVRLVTPPNGIVLDPFGGSGTTAEAAIMEGVRCVIIERDDTYIPLIQHRIDRATGKA